MEGQILRVFVHDRLEEGDVTLAGGEHRQGRYASRTCNGPKSSGSEHIPWHMRIHSLTRQNCKLKSENALDFRPCKLMLVSPKTPECACCMQ